MKIKRFLKFLGKGFDKVSYPIMILIVFTLLVSSCNRSSFDVKVQVPEGRVVTVYVPVEYRYHFAIGDKIIVGRTLNQEKERFEYEFLQLTSVTGKSLWVSRDKEKDFTPIKGKVVEIEHVE